MSSYVLSSFLLVDQESYYIDITLKNKKFTILSRSFETAISSRFPIKLICCSALGSAFTACCLLKTFVI